MSTVDVDRLVARVEASAWLEIPLYAVPATVVSEAVDAGRVQVVADGCGGMVIRNVPDRGMPDDSLFSQVGATAAALETWRGRLVAMVRHTRTVIHTHPEDTATIEALCCACRIFSQLIGVAWNPNMVR